MSIELTEEQRQAFSSDPSQCRLIDPMTKEAYVLVRAEVYERLRSLLEEEFDPRDAYPLIDRIMAEDDAADPSLESYQRFRRNDRS